MTSKPDQREADARLPSIDWARGIAVLIMILAHVSDAWTRPDDRGTAAYRYLTLVGGFAAPLFLWLSGMSLVLAGEAALRRTGSRRAARQRLIRRGLELFILAFAFRAHSYVFNPGGSALTLFRVDILNVLGVAMTAAGLIWGSVGSWPTRLVLFATATAATAMATPVVRLAEWVDLLPLWLQWHVRPAGEHTVFTLFPWAGFVFAGSAAGVVATVIRERGGAVRVRGWLLASGLAVLLLGLYTGSLPTLYRQSSYWSSSPAFFAVRVGVMLIALAGLERVVAFHTAAPAVLQPIQRLGQASLLIYWIHVQLVYGWATRPLHRNLSLWQMLAGYVLFCSAMYAVIPMRDRLRHLRGRRSQIEGERSPLASV